MHVAEQHVAGGRHIEPGRQPAHIDAAGVADLGAQQGQLGQVGEVRLEELHRHTLDAQAAAREQRRDAGLALELDRPGRALAVARDAADLHAEAQIGRRHRAVALPFELLQREAQARELEPHRFGLPAVGDRVGEPDPAAFHQQVREPHLPGRRRCLHRRGCGGGRRRPVLRQPTLHVQLARTVTGDLHGRLHQLDPAECDGAREHIDLDICKRKLLQRNCVGTRLGARLAQLQVVEHEALERELQARRIGGAGPVEPRLRGELPGDAGHQRLREIRREAGERDAAELELQLRLAVGDRAFCRKLGQRRRVGGLRVHSALDDDGNRLRQRPLQLLRAEVQAL